MITIVERLEYRASSCGDDTQKYLLLIQHHLSETLDDFGSRHL